MTAYPPEPCRAPKAAIQAAAESYAGQIDFEPGGSLLAVVESLGGKILYKDFMNPGSDAESIHVRAVSDFDIFVPHDTASVRDRFTIAHELGHLLLHYPVVCKNHGGHQVEMKALRYLPPNASESLKRCEWEANWFAASFLMPSPNFIENWNRLSSLSAIARHYQVSTAAAENRIKSLNLTTG